METLAAISQELLEYTPVDVNDIRDVDDVLRAVRIIHQQPPQPVELCGKTAASLLLQLFYALVPSTTEITYRGTPQGPATIIHSTFDSALVVRPADVRQPLQWSDNELQEFERLQRRGRQSNSMPDPMGWWSAAQLADQPLRVYLSKLYASVPTSPATITDALSPEALLITANWYRIHGQQVRVNSNAA